MRHFKGVGVSPNSSAKALPKKKFEKNARNPSKKILLSKLITMGRHGADVAQAKHTFCMDPITNVKE